MSETTRALSYFAEDGNYGNAGGMTIMETTHWTELDWEIIEQVSDEHRPVVARLLTESYEPDADGDFIRKELEEKYGLDFGFADEEPEEFEPEDG
jgi:hypothetical protein